MIVVLTFVASPTAVHARSVERRLGAAASSRRVYLPAVVDGCTVGPVPAALGLDPFYVKYCAVGNLPIVSSAGVSDKAVQVTAGYVQRMLSKRPDVLAMIAKNHTRVGVIGVSQVTSDMPEYRNIYTVFPGTDWNTRARGLGATPFMPLSSVGEENVLCLPTDPYLGESILVHEFGHTIKIMGLEFIDPTFKATVQAAYDAAIGAGKWANTYAGSNAEEYWAEGVQDYFNTNIQAIPTNGIHNFVHTRAQLAVYDPTLYALINQGFGDVAWTPVCPV